MTAYADTLADDQRRRYRVYAYASTWIGGFSDVMLDNSAVIILYFALLKSSDTLIMLSTGLIGIVSMFLLIPASGLIDRLGPKRVVQISCYLAAAAFALMAAAPFAGQTAAPCWVLAGCFIFSISRPLCSAAWYPIVNEFLQPRERGEFFGFMRFSYYIITGSAFALLGLLTGPSLPLWAFQLILVITGTLALGRCYFINRIDLPPHQQSGGDLAKAFRTSTQNGPLVGFSVYNAMLCLAFSAVLPLTLIYLKNGLHFGDNLVQVLAAVGIAGSICGFFVYGKLLRQWGLRKLQLFTHAALIAIPLGLFLCGQNTPFLAVAIGSLLFAGNFAFGCFNCAFSQEILALARPGNLTMATAFGQTYQMIGTAAGRTLASLLLSNGLLAASWQWGGVTFCQFQTVFLLCALGALFCLVLIFCLPSVSNNRQT